uniref:Uncharacterized protein n=1 Tax=Timema tahoe TaxID=61484 RepID=A0A7R9II90_9NEOP|nr:unnamed protein product [Timema tahoe]
MINGTNCLNKRVQDLFCSVQLNVNNPHFLIMQGRITKVLNMKPPEILSMIEEAAGTSMYEVKRMSTRSTIERKDIKMKELSSVVKEEIAPKLEKMKTERQQVMEYNKIQRELDLLTRLYVAWRYVSAEETAEKAKIQVQQVHDKIGETRRKIVDGATEVEELNKLVQELQSKVDSEKGGVLETLEKQLKEKEKLEAKALANQKNIKDTLASEEKNKKQLAKSLKEYQEGYLKRRQPNPGEPLTPGTRVLLRTHPLSDALRESTPGSVPDGLDPTWCRGHVAHTYIGSEKRREMLLKKSKHTGTSYKYVPASLREDVAHSHTVGDNRHSRSQLPDDPSLNCALIEPPRQITNASKR